MWRRFSRSGIYEGWPTIHLHLSHFVEDLLSWHWSFSGTSFDNSFFEPWIQIQWFDWSRACITMMDKKTPWSARPIWVSFLIRPSWFSQSSWLDNGQPNPNSKKDWTSHTSTAGWLQLKRLLCLCLCLCLCHCHTSTAGWLQLKRLPRPSTTFVHAAAAWYRCVGLCGSQKS